jgi:hypothetical protein
VLGSPIRTPWDHSSVDNSPRPIAASHVLHRLLVPRHPPCALSNLTYNQIIDHKPHNHPKRGGHRRSQTIDARIHCAILNKHTTTTTTNQQTPTTSAVLVREMIVHKKTPQIFSVVLWLFSQDPTGCPPPPPTAPKPTVPYPQPDQLGQQVLLDRQQAAVGDDSPVSPPSSTPTPHPGAAGSSIPFRTRCS